MFSFAFDLLLALFYVSVSYVSCFLSFLTDFQILGHIPISVLTAVSIFHLLLLDLLNDGRHVLRLLLLLVDDLDLMGLLSHVLQRLNVLLVDVLHVHLVRLWQLASTEADIAPAVGAALLLLRH